MHMAFPSLDNSVCLEGLPLPSRALLGRRVGAMTHVSWKIFWRREMTDISCSRRDKGIAFFAFSLTLTQESVWGAWGYGG